VPKKIVVIAMAFVDFAPIVIAGRGACLHRCTHATTTPTREREWAAQQKITQTTDAHNLKIVPGLSLRHDP